MQNESRKIANTLHHTFEGTPWHGKSLMEILQNVDEDNCNLQLNESHTILALVQHITSWRKFVIEKLKGNDAFDLTVEENFKESKVEWNKALENLKKTQEELLHLIRQSPVLKLEDKVPGRTYTFEIMLHGLIHHDIYHAGQLAMILHYGKRKSVS